MLVAIVIPCFNEGENVTALIEEICLLGTVDANRYHFFFVDNGSIDGSFMDLSSTRNDRFSIVQLESNQGYGGAIKFGLKSAAESGVTYKYFGWIHGDRQIALSEALGGINSIIEGREVDAGSGVRSAGLFQYLQSRLFDVLVSFRLGIPIYDCNAQPKIFHRKYLERFCATWTPNDFSFDLYWWFTFHYLLKKTKVNRFKVKFSGRTEGVAKGGGGSFASRLKTLFKCLSACDDFRREMTANDNSPPSK